MLSPKKKGFLFPYVAVAPGVILMLLVIFLPFLQNIGYSFTDYSLLNPNLDVTGFVNYRDILQEGEFFGALSKSMIWVVLNMVLILFIGLAAAFVQNSKSMKGVVVLQVFLLLPWILPEVVSGYTWKLLLNYQMGPYYKLLEFLHVIPQGEDIFSNDLSAMLAVVFANVWRSFPIVAIMVYAKLQSLSSEQIEAAVMDGANRFVLFLNIELPHIGATLMSVLTLCFIWTFNAFGIIHVMTDGGPAGATETLPILLQRKAFKFYDYSYSSSFAVLMIITLILVVVLLHAIPRLFHKNNPD